MTQLSKRQFELLTATLGPQRTEAAHAVLFDGATDGAAERQAHGQKTRTVRRDVNRIESELARAVELVNAGNCATLAGFTESDNCTTVGEFIEALAQTDAVHGKTKTMQGENT